MNIMKFDIQRFSGVWDYNYPQRLYIQRTHELTDRMRQDQILAEMRNMQREQLILNELNRQNSTSTSSAQSSSNSEQSDVKVENRTANIAISAQSDANAPLYNYANNVTIVGAGTGKSSVNNQGDNVIIAGLDDRTARIANAGEDVTMLGGSSGNIISSSNANHAVIAAGSGNDSVSISYTDNVTDSENLVFGGNGNDTIISNGAGDIISGESGKDYIKVKSDSYVQGELDDDTISFSGSSNVIYGNEGNDNIEGAYGINVQESNNFIFAGAGNDTVERGSVVLGGEGKDSLTEGWLVFGGADNDSLTGISVSGGEGNDNIHASVIGYGGNGNDTIYSNANGATLIGGKGNDSISAIGDNSNNLIILGGEGDDLINTGYKGRSGNTIFAGKGNDTIEISYPYSAALVKTTDVRIIYNDGDGDDYITIPKYYSSYERDNVTINLDIIGRYSTVTSGDDIIVHVGIGSITVASAAAVLKDSPWNFTFNINSKQVSVPDVSEEIAALDEFEEELNEAAEIKLVNSNTSSSTSISKGVDNNIVKNYNIYTYSGGDKVINNYQQGEVVRLDDYQGLDDISGNSFYIKSKSGRLEIQNSRDKFIGYSAGNSDVIAYSYVASGGGNVDGRGKSQAEILIGADHQNNQIFAGNGGSSVWGGNGGADTLVGGDGYDEFVFAQGSGGDVIQNAGSNDIVNLLGVTLDQIADVSVSQEQVHISFTNGEFLQVKGNSGLGYRLQNQTYVCNQSTGQWSTK